MAAVVIGWYRQIKYGVSLDKLAVGMTWVSRPIRICYRTLLSKWCTMIRCSIICSLSYTHTRSAMLHQAMVISIQVLNQTGASKISNLNQQFKWTKITCYSSTWLATQVKMAKMPTKFKSKMQTREKVEQVSCLKERDQLSRYNKTIRRSWVKSNMDSTEAAS